MAIFLAWLYSVAFRVQQWFGDQFALLYAGAFNAWTWAVTQATNAYNNATAYAYRLFQAFQNDLSGLSNWAQYQLGLLWTAVNALSSITPSQVLTWIQGQLTPIYNAINAARAYLQGLIDALRNELISFFQAAIATARDAIANTFAWVTNWRARIIELFTTLKSSDLPNLIKLARELYVNIENFFADPVTWIFDILSADLLAALSWLIAMALGATQSDLPYNPPWKGKR